jgi:uncharacterized protein YaaQ
MTAASGNPTKLCIIVVQEADVRRLMSALSERHFVATTISSTGGFLRRGSATVLTSVDAGDVTTVVNLLHAQFPAGTELVPTSTLPWWDEGEADAETVEVRLGGAVIFVIDVERAERS